MNHFVACPLCAGLATSPVYHHRYGAFSQSGKAFPFSVHVCDECGFVFVPEGYRPELKERYSEIYAHFEKSAFFPFPHRKRENELAVEMIASHIAGPRPDVLEIGSNRGDLLYLLKERIPQANVLGIDPAAGDGCQVPTIRGFFERERLGAKFDCVILQHVLEHLPYPCEVMEQIGEILKEGGIVYVEVPDLHYSIEHGIEDFMPEHISYFERSSLERCMASYDPVEVSRPSFIHSVFRFNPRRYGVEYAADPARVRASIEGFVERKEALRREFVLRAKESRRIIFFGVSFYFRMLFSELREELGTERCFYIDNSFPEPREPVYGLPRLEAFGDGDLVMLCANNVTVQAKMLDQIPTGSSISVLAPWSSFHEL